MKSNLLKFSVSPINNIGEGILKGKYSSAALNDVSINLHSGHSFEGLSMFGDLISQKHKVTYWATLQKVKDIYLVPVCNSGLKGICYPKDMEQMVTKLSEYGLKVCEHAPNYLLGLITMLCPKKLPEGLPGSVDIVAVEESSSVVTRGEKGWLHVHIHPYVKDLGIYKQSEFCLQGMQKMLLAEDL